MSDPQPPAQPAGPVYLDHAATHPVLPAAARAVHEQLLRGGNPSSLHASGRAARRVLEESRDTIAAAVEADPVEIILTSGGTEADNLAVTGLWEARTAEDPGRDRVIVSSIEHPAVQEPAEHLARHRGAQLELLEVDGLGRTDPAALREMLARDPGSVALVAVMWANNEVGTVQPIAQLAEVCAEFQVPLHVDAVQALGALPVSSRLPGLTTLAVSGHKIGAPVGSGALVVGRGAQMAPLLHGGGQQRGLRPGTLDAAGAAGFAAAVREATADLPGESQRLAQLRDRLIDGIRAAVPQAVLRGPLESPHTGQRLPGNVHFTFPGCEGDSLLFLLDAAGFATSTGSACTAGVPRPSRILLAMGLDEVTARGAQRFTLGRGTTASDVDALIAALPQIHDRALAAGLSGT
ncbi:cysteine desulfurase [Kocuria sp. p3-SID1433]|uniref:cysteine desulfurase family protein n=1 Tax=unclassified Kocuria TaxID=2649579 RepID=UPI0021A888EA|nr:MULTISPECIES: cysteine desulfurase family protein [unclassified Kocuria]MCT1601515.1 cysteine desulfurase [Kocuria sp. p3-SID1428]MCT2180105.1 cysteine desulfurase [Kocuria sp. p3-SID1433]